MSLRRLGPILLAGGVAALAFVSCGQRSLVLVQVISANVVSYSDVNLVIRANKQQQTRFDQITFDSTMPYRAGIYLSSDVSGTVTFNAEVDDPRQNCIVGMGSVPVTNVSPGKTVNAPALEIMSVQPCIPIVDGGSTGTAGAAASGGGPGTGGGNASGGHAGGSATGGTIGTGGAVGTGGAIGTGGNKGTGGLAATGGTTGTGGLATGGALGTGGNKGTGGLMGTGGIVSTGGVMGSGGIAGAGGVIGSGGIKGTGGAGSGGIVGSGGVVGTGGVVGSGGVVGTGGTTGCTCSNPNQTCNPSTGACTCNQTPAQACSAAGVGCGSAVDDCGDTVTCTCPLNFICDTTTQTCISRCVTGTGGIVTASSPDIVCPATP